ncbi:MAG: hypothetical protein V8S54_06330 [Lachnospiraceae bacterium]
MKEEEAISNIEAFLSSLELGTSLGEREALALSKEDMLSIQNAMKSDEDYKSFYESGKFQEQIFDADDEMYYIKYSFSLDGVPVFGEGDPTVASVRRSGSTVICGSYGCYIFIFKFWNL